jgi:HEAT repeat protein
MEDEAMKLAKRLNSRSAYERADAAERLGSIGDPSAVPLLVGRLADRSAEVRMRVVGALRRLGASESEVFVHALLDKDELVRVEAAEALAVIGERQTLTPLRRALKDPSPLVRSYVAAAIGAVGSRADRRLLKRLHHSERSDTARLGLLEGLWLLKDSSALADAFLLLYSPDYRVRHATSKALGSTFLNGRTRSKISAALRARGRVETSRAVRTAIREVLTQL